MTKAILVLNAGSSSIKFALYQMGELALLARGQITEFVKHLSSQSLFEVSQPDQSALKIQLDTIHNHQQATAFIINWISQDSHPWELIAAGHRVVHGGPIRDKPAIVDADVFAELKMLEPLAPQHQPHNLNAIQAISENFPKIQQVACFDTAFHANQGAVNRLLPLPEFLRNKGLMNYGFHGLSYEYLVGQVTDRMGGVVPEKMVIAHLGNGASACAVKNGVSEATTMGFSTLDGLVMGSRCGSIDPGVLLHLLKTEGMDSDELSHILYEQSGLLGLSGLSSDIRDLVNSNSEQAKIALKVYIISLVKHITSLASVLEGLDTLVFTGGVGENSAYIRESVIKKLSWLGCEIDHNANNRGQSCITRKQSKIKVLVLPTNEELIIARQTMQLCQDCSI
ncbi:MAG: acetate/propionate family kinase [Thiotrichaceae bacterium]|nr:acetate/propionate family kinase [Thiotrichaceae bacterium]